MAHHLAPPTPTSRISPPLSPRPPLFNNPPSPITHTSLTTAPTPHMSNPTPMPARGDRNAPVFDSQKPHELRRYFSDLEFLLGRASITVAAEKKQHATRFLTVEDQEIWEVLPSFTDAAKSYDDFKAEVLKLYAGNDEERRFSLGDLDALIGQYSRVGIITKDDLTSFYHQFLRITTYLIGKSRLSTAEQSRAFLRAMQPHYLLQSNNDLYEAAEFVIAGSVGTLTIATAPAPEVKSDPGITALVSTVTKLITVLATQQASNANTNGSGTSKRPRPDGCGYCSDLDHFINQCPHVVTDTNAGKCRRNSDGRVVFPSGAFVPRSIPGKDLRTRLEEWHRQNPGQLAAAQLLVEMAVEQLSATPTLAAPTVRTYTLSDKERMESLQHEMDTLLTCAQAKKALEASRQQDEPDLNILPSRAPAAAPSMPLSPATPTIPAATHVAPPQHPLSGARDAAYAPPKERNFGIPPQKPAYRTTAPIYDEKDAVEVFGAAMDSTITMTQRQLLSISPEVRAQMREVTTSRRAPAKDGNPPNVLVQQIIHEIESPLPYYPPSALDHDSLEEQRSKDAHHTAMFDSLPTAFIQASNTSNLPSDACIVPDPFAIYYDNGTIPDDLIVSMESSAIRSILPIIDNREQVECIVDGGSQIIAMSESVCHELALSYDPCIILRMQSANGSVSPSLGLARNVPFHIGDITLYLQVHIVRNPAYDVLLGRPFDVLTQSIVRNFANEDQTITICDPNTGKLATVPTVPHGPPRSRPQGFPNSRN
ncbi:hypothetical protein DFH07DRAFT_871063 [Mycena maculata]|uniref:DUF4100 domain-containing protein n=1 Tax=Mycena maculata TaxID=230809 RepID=A0AAD7I114_9AGAR|nr:hypothetical protein DFH07DRAFT_871063 [Mycena maculata]